MTNLPLSPQVFYILLALNLKESHGYEIMKQVTIYSKGYVKLGPGTLYGAIKRLLKEKLIEESDEKIDEDINSERRKYYRLTDKGREIFGIEVERLSDAIKIANNPQVNIYSL